ncbi:MAG: phBC6A51 family helix-turn-helix protein [Methanomethylovorans sp.]|uniref:phBC6A51 family helix-turn-helix protein n=1 Tax=Methanomethylovorans sp. TaxID=2758717 RepID=UPI003C77512A
MKPQIEKEWKWTNQRYKAARLLAEGELTQQQIATECHVIRQTIYNWLKQPEFLEKVNEYVLADERATKAGLLRRCYKTLEEKSKLAATDRTTELDYLKFIADAMGYTDKKNNVNIVNTTYPGVSNTPEVKEACSELCRLLREADDAADNM